MSYHLSHLRELESESIYIIRETAAQFERPVLLFSGGKDSIVMLHLARKAFFPATLPFPILHIDTGHNFPETIAFRDALVAQMNLRLIVGYVQHSIDKGTATEERGPEASRIRLQTVTLLEAIEQNRFDAALGGARRDEEKARAKERFFSHRDEFGQWDAKNQRPELWNIFNGRKQQGEHFRVFPLSNWTELDIWQYIAEEKIALPELYFSHKRLCLQRNGIWLAYCDYIPLRPNEQPIEKVVRFRTIGDMTSTGATESEASSLADIIAEIATSRYTERGGRADDKRSETSMEDRKKEGYF
jgi:sulfate adenylyltransferase subunit 2